MVQEFNLTSTRNLRFLVVLLFLSWSALLVMPIGSGDLRECTNVHLHCFIDSGSHSQVITVARSPENVEYFHDVNVTVSGLNATTTSNVTLFYRTDGRSWQEHLMTNGSSSLFWGIIPQQAWPSFVEYYVNATHLDGNVTVENNQGQYYNYTVIDTIPPEIQISQPRNGELFQGLVTFDVDFSDAGSGIARHLDYINENLVGNGTADSYVSVTDLPNGEYEFTLHVFDHAGNQAEAHVVFRVEKPFAIPVIFYSLGALGAIIVICIIVGAWLYQKEN